MAELDDLAVVYVAQIDVRQATAERLASLVKEFQQAFNANDPAKAGPVAQSIADLANSYVKLAAVDAKEREAAKS